MHWLRVFATTCLLLGALPMITACTRGQVVDAAGQPLEGVFVMAIWHGYVPGPVESHSRCYAFEITKTGKNGHYLLPYFSWNFNPLLWGRYRYHDYYLAGYERAPSNESGTHTEMMWRITGSVESRLKNIGAPTYMDCVSEADWKAKLAPLYRAHAEEARKIAVTMEEKRTAFAFDSAAIEAEVGHEAATAILAERIKQRIPVIAVPSRTPQRSFPVSPP